MAEMALHLGAYLFLYSTVVILLAWGVVRCASTLPAASKHATWMVAFAVLLLLPLGHRVVPGWNVDLGLIESASTEWNARADSSVHSSAGSGIAGTTWEGSRFAQMGGTESASQTTGRAGSAQSSSQEGSAWSAVYVRASRWLVPAFLLIWGAGVLLLLGRLGWGLAQLLHWKQSTSTLDCDGLAERLAGELDLSRTVIVRSSSEAPVPLAWGVMHPVVILPADASDWPPTRLRAVLLHELAHVKRWDYLTHLFSRTARALFWPNPLMWIASNRAKAAQEQACDDAVLRSGVASWSYAEELLAMAKNLQRSPFLDEAVALDAGRSFKSRMRALLRSSASRRSVTPRELSGLVLGGLLLLALVSAVQIGGPSGSSDQVEHHWMEAETATLPPAFALRDEAEASDGAYVEVTHRAEDLDTPPTTEPAVYSFETTRSDRYLVWARVRVRSTEHDSFWVRVDSSRWIRCNSIEPGEQWHWVQIRDTDQEGQPVAFTLSEGTHRLSVGAREDGIEVDRLLVTNDWHYRPHTPRTTKPAPSEPNNIWLEAEDGWIQSPLRVTNSPKAVGWQHVEARAEENSIDAPPAVGHATYSFSVSRAGTYRLWGRVIATSTGHDSFWIRMDDGRWIRWNQIRRGDDWHWDQVHDSDADRRPVQFDLSAGSHKLTVAYRERHAKLDRLLLTSSPTYRPRSLGDRPDAPASVSTVFSASAAELVDPMVHRSDSQSTPSISWIEVPDGPGNDAPDGGSGAATWTFTVPHAGQYALWGEVMAPAQNDNSFFVAMDGGEEIPWHIPTTSTWEWNPVSNESGDMVRTPVIFSLDAGTHKLRLRNREDGTRLRRVRLRNVPAASPPAVAP